MRKKRAGYGRFFVKDSRTIAHTCEGKTKSQVRPWKMSQKIWTSFAYYWLFDNLIKAGKLLYEDLNLKH